MYVDICIRTDYLKNLPWTHKQKVFHYYICSMWQAQKDQCKSLSLFQMCFLIPKGTIVTVAEHSLGGLLTAL